MKALPTARALPAGSGAAVTVTVLLLLLAGRYELHGDELYFRMLPLAWWYDDQPPITVWLAQLAKALGDAAWVQRVPAALAAGAGALLAAAFPRLLGYGPRVQRVAAWAHATTVYPLIVGHVFLTSTLDLLAWQTVTWCVVAAALGRPRFLTWAGLLAGIACWNKLLVLPLVGALALSLLLLRRDLLFSRHALRGVVALTLVGGPQIVAQAVHGWPMSAVSGDLITVNGAVNRPLVLPLLVAFVGPPIVGVCLRGLRWRPGGSTSTTTPPHVADPTGRPTPPRSAGDAPATGSGRDRATPVAGPTTPWWGLLTPAAVVLVAWNLWAPAQPYYAVALLLCALALGWGPACDAGSVLWRRAPGVIAANAAVAALVALPVLPVPSAAFDVASTINPVSRDQVGWTGYVRQVDTARGGPDVAVVTDAYSLAGAIDHVGDGIPVASGHNALWRMGPPPGDDVLLVGERAVAMRGGFDRCEDAGRLTRTDSDPFGVADSPMIRCHGPLGGWPALWPAFRHLGA